MRNLKAGKSRHSLRFADWQRNGIGAEFWGASVANDSPISDPVPALDGKCGGRS